MNLVLLAIYSKDTCLYFTTSETGTFWHCIWHVGLPSQCCVIKICFFFSSFLFHWKAEKLERDRVGNGNWFPFIIPLTNLEQWPVPSDVDSRHNPDGGHLSKATPLYFHLYLYLYFYLHLVLQRTCIAMYATISMGLSSGANRATSITSGNAAVTELQFYRHL